MGFGSFGLQNFGRVQGNLSCQFMLSLFKCIKWFWWLLLIWVRVSNLLSLFTRTTRTIDSIRRTSHLRCIVYRSERKATAKIYSWDFRRRIAMQIVIPSQGILKFFLQIFEAIPVCLVQLCIAWNDYATLHIHWCGCAVWRQSSRVKNLKKFGWWTCNTSKHV